MYCLMLGATNDYKEKADAKQTQNHNNNMEILRHLTDTGTHQNIISLLAFQFKPLPFFYIEESCQEENLLELLLTKRRDQDWLPTLQLAGLYSEALDAIQFLHQKRVVHRDITALKFVFCRNRTSIKLADFSLAKIANNKENVSVYGMYVLCFPYVE